MSKSIRQCVRCRCTLDESDLARGEHVETKDGLYCGPCALALDKRPAAPSPGTEITASPAETIAGLAEDIEAIREQVETIQRTLLYEKTTAWNVAGGVAQCLAIGMVLMGGLAWLDGGGNVLNLLLLSIVFQIMALTFFVKGK